MTKREFIIQYVLARASHRVENFSAEAAAHAAERVWDVIRSMS